MNKQQYLLTKLAEEAAEVGQRALKMQQFGKEEKEPGQDFTNEQRLNQELNDLSMIVRLLKEECGLDLYTDPWWFDIKKPKVEKYMKYSQELGMVDK